MKILKKPDLDQNLPFEKRIANYLEKRFNNKVLVIVLGSLFLLILNILLYI